MNNQWPLDTAVSFDPYFGEPSRDGDQGREDHERQTDTGTAGAVQRRARLGVDQTRGHRGVHHGRRR